MLFIVQQMPYFDIVLVAAFPLNVPAYIPIGFHLPRIVYHHLFNPYRLPDRRIGKDLSRSGNVLLRLLSPLSSSRLHSAGFTICNAELHS